MATINYSNNPKTNTYLIFESGVTFEMSYSYFTRLVSWIKAQYKDYYTEDSRGVFNWYREDLLPEERKNIKVNGLETDDEFAE